MSPLNTAPNPSTPEGSGIQEILKREYSRLSRYRVAITVAFISICVVFAVVYLMKSYKNKKNDEAFYRLSQSNTVDELEALKSDYLGAKTYPYILYKLACTLHESEDIDALKLDRAVLYLKEIINSYPNEKLIVENSQKRLKQIKEDREWIAGKLNDQIKKLRDEYNQILNPKIIGQNEYPIVTVKTNKGEFDIELFEDDTSNTVANFISLVKKGAYKNTYVFQVEKTGLYLGCSKGDGTSSQGYTIPLEKNKYKNEEGYVGMVRKRDPAYKEGSQEKEEFLNSADAKFYICFQTQPELDGKCCVFGRVVRNFKEVVKKLVKNDKIQDIFIVQIREHNYVPNTIPTK